MLLIKSNFRWMISKMMVLELKGTIGYGKNQLDIVFLRGHSKLSIPIVFENYISIKFYILVAYKAFLIFTIPLLLPYLWNKKVVKPYWVEDVTKRAKKRKMELE